MSVRIGDTRLESDTEWKTYVTTWTYDSPEKQELISLAEHFHDELGFAYREMRVLLQQAVFKNLREGGEFWEQLSKNAEVIETEL